MEAGCGRATAWKDKCREFLERLLETIDQRLEHLDILGANALYTGLLSMSGIGRRQRGTEIEERALDISYRIFEGRIRPGRSGRSERRVQLVYVSIGRHP